MCKHDTVKYTNVQFRREMCDNPQISGGSNRPRPTPLLGAFLCVFSFLFCFSPRGRSGWRTVPLPHIVNVAKIKKNQDKCVGVPPPPPPPHPPLQTCKSLFSSVCFNEINYLYIDGRLIRLKTVKTNRTLGQPRTICFSSYGGISGETVGALKLKLAPNFDLWGHFFCK